MSEDDAEKASKPRKMSPLARTLWLLAKDDDRAIAPHVARAHAMVAAAEDGSLARIIEDAPN